MVHNGIEYGDMQLICEAYHLMRDLLGMSVEEMQQIFSRWHEGRLESYLIEITADILAYRDNDGSPLIDKILDAAGQKGTGKWTVGAALDYGIPLSLISESVFARCLSARRDERLRPHASWQDRKTCGTRTRKSFSPTWRRPCSWPRSSPTPRVSAFCRPPRPITAGICP